MSLVTLESGPTYVGPTHESDHNGSQRRQIINLHTGGLSTYRLMKSLPEPTLEPENNCSRLVSLIMRYTYQNKLYMEREVTLRRMALCLFLQIALPNECCGAKEN